MVEIDFPAVPAKTGVRSSCQVGTQTALFLCDARATGDRLEGRGNPLFGKARQRSLTSKTPRRLLTVRGG